MELRQAEYLLAVVEHGSYTAASQALFVSQPAVSFSLSQLRDDLGADVFVPGSRPARLTEFGRDVVVVARRLLEDGELARAAVRHPSSLTIAVDAPLLDDPVCRIIRDFNRDFPDVRLTILDPVGRESAMAWLAGYRCEAAFVEGPGFRTPHVAHVVAEQRLTLVAPPGASLPIGADVEVGDLGGIPLILPPLLSWTRGAILEAFERAGAVPRVAVECEAHEAIWPLVLHGAGMALVPPLLAELAQTRGLQVRRIRPAIVRTVQVLHRSGSPSPALAGLLAASDLANLKTRPTHLNAPGR